MTGPRGISNTYGYLYNQTPQEIDVGENFSFQHNRNFVGGLAHIEGTPDLYVWQPGDYVIIGTIFHIEVLQIGIFRNGVLLNGSVMGDQLAATNLTFTRIIRIRPSDMITPTDLSPTGLACLIQVRNHISYTTIRQDGAASTGLAPLQNNIDVVMFLLNPDQPEA